MELTQWQRGVQSCAERMIPHIRRVGDIHGLCHGDMSGSLPRVQYMRPQFFELKREGISNCNCLMLTTRRAGLGTGDVDHLF